MQRQGYRTPASIRSWKFNNYFGRVFWFSNLKTAYRNQKFKQDEDI